MRDRRDYLIAALAAAFLFCLGLLLGQRVSVLPAAGAQDSGSGNGAANGTLDGDGPGATGGVTIQPTPSIRPGLDGRTSSTITTDSDSNNRFVAVTSPVGSGENVLFLIDSHTEQVAVYRYRKGRGLEFLAGRKIEYDLKITGYQDISEFSYDQMRDLYQKQVAKAAAQAVKKK